jgi:hypothetical protein
LIKKMTQDNLYLLALNIVLKPLLSQRSASHAL